MFCFKYLFIHLFIFGHAGSSLVALLEELRSLFSPVVSRGYSLATVHRLLTVVECRVLGVRAQQMWGRGLVASWHVESS